MKYVRTILIVTTTLILAGIIYLIYTSKVPNDVIQTTELQKILSIPDEETNEYISNPVNLIISDDLIYISDTGRSMIHVFDSKGNFLSSIGSSGRGPTEFMAQNKIEYNENKLIVFDQGNRRFTIINIKDNSFTIFPFKYQHLPYSFAVRDGLIYMYIPYHHSMIDKLDDLPLIHIYEFSEEISHVASFGEHLNFVSAMIPYASMSHLKIYKEKLYVQFLLYPILRIYSLDGTLLQTISFNDLNLDYNERVRNNYQSDVFRDIESKRVKTLVGNFDINDKGLFLNIYDDNALIIDHYDHNFNFVTRYKYNFPSKRFFIRDLKVLIDENSDLYFYALYTRNNPGIDIYR